MTEAVAPEQRYYKARGASLALWTDRRPEIVLSGPAGTGKSRAVLEKLHAICLRWPGARGLIVRKTRASLTQSALVTFEEKVLPARSPVKSGPTRAHRESYKYPNGSEIVVGGMDRPERVMSTEYDFIYPQEAIELTIDDWEALVTRNRNFVVPFQQVVGDANPSSPQHWLYQRCRSGLAAMLDSRHEDNPVLWDEDAGEWTPKGVIYIASLDRLTGVRKLRLRHGKWVQAEGQVYDGFDPAIHVLDVMPAGWESWRKLRSIDFGYTNPFVCQWWAVDGDGRLYLYRELYRTGRTVKVHSGRIKELSGPERHEATVADHDAEDRATLAENGIPTVPARKAITPGIQAVQERLKVAGDGRPRIYFLRDALVERDDSLAEAKLPCSTLDEIDGYVWPKGQDGKSVKEVPVDRDNHGMDAMRYMAACFDVGHVRYGFID